MRKQILLFTLVGIFCAGLSTSLALRDKNTTVYADTEYTLVGNIDNNAQWNVNPNDGKWKLTKTNNEYVIKNVHMTAHEYSDFRIITWGAWTNDYGWPKVTVNEPGFTATGADNNIHITRTGYYDIRMYDSNSKIDITYSTYTLAGNIDNNNEWNITPKSGLWKLTKTNNEYVIRDVYMVAHSSSDFRIIGWDCNDWVNTSFGWNKVVVNEPGFRSSGVDNNIHITKTGYFNIRLYDNKTKIDITNSTTKATLEVQINANGQRVFDDSRFDCTFTYNNSTSTTYSALDGSKRVSANPYTKFFVTDWTMPDGYYLSDYRLGYTDNTDSYHRPGSSSYDYKNTMLKNDSGTAVINYIILYFWTTNDGATKDYPFLVEANNEVSTFFDGCDVGIYCYGGGIAPAQTLKVERSGSYLLGTVIIPKGTLYMRVVRASSGSLPCTGRPATVYNEWDEITFNYRYNEIKILNWNTYGSQASDRISYNSHKAVLLPDRPVFFDTQDSGFWFGDNAVAYAVTGSLSNYYGYTASEGWHELTRINTSGYIYFVPTEIIIAPQVIVTRNDPSGSGWGKKWNQTTDMTVNYGFNPLYTTMVETGKTGDNYNWGNKSAVETASEYGYYFMDKITCSGGGSITSPSSNWTVVSNMYSNLTNDVKNEVFKAAANEQGTNIEQAMARYDYIVFFKQYTGYADFINRRLAGSGRSAMIRYNFLDLYPLSMDYVTFITVFISASLCILLTLMVVKKRCRR